MPYEVELKFLLEDRDEFASRLEKLGATPASNESQSDIYFQHPARDFSQTDEAMRIRTIGEKNILTYKGPLLDSETKTRHELEVEFQPGNASRDVMNQLLNANGYQSVLIVTKKRQSYRFTKNDRRFEIALDLVDGLGEFVEVETIAEENDRDQAKREILELAEELQLKRQERRGYLRLLLEKQSPT